VLPDKVRAALIPCDRLERVSGSAAPSESAGLHCNRIVWVLLHRCAAQKFHLAPI